MRNQNNFLLIFLCLLILFQSFNLIDGKFSKCDEKDCSTFNIKQHQKQRLDSQNMGKENLELPLNTNFSLENFIASNLEMSFYSSFYNQLLKGVIFINYELVPTAVASYHDYISQISQFLCNVVSNSENHPPFLRK
jgi:hypothetical protein